MGTLTVLKAGGSQPSIVRYNNHCEKHGSVDTNFCTETPWWHKFVLWFKDTDLSVNDEFGPAKASFEFKAIALVAPIGAVFSDKEISKIKFKVANYRLENDDEVKYPFHAEYLSKLLEKNNLEYNVYKGVHHYAFIPPLFPLFQPGFSKRNIYPLQSILKQFMRILFDSISDKTEYSYLIY